MNKKLDRLLVIIETRNKIFRIVVPQWLCPNDRLQITSPLMEDPHQDHKDHVGPGDKEISNSTTILRSVRPESS